MKIRSVHPEFFADQKVAQLSPLARLFYIGLWCVADDYGRGRLLLKTLEGEVFPHDIVDIQQLVFELEKRAFIRVYEVDGERFFHIPSWEDWQKPRYKADSKLPSPELGQVVDSLAPEPDRLWTDSDRVSEKRAQGEGEGEGAAALRRPKDARPAFEVFHTNRAAAEVLQRKQRTTILNPAAYAKSIADDPDFRMESERLWLHRDCSDCGGRGFSESYAPGAGMVKTNCELP